MPCLLLANCCPIDDIAMRGNILNPESDEIASAQLAVDGQIEHRQVAHSPLELELGPNAPDVLWSKRLFCSNQFALIPGLALGYPLGRSFHSLAWSSPQLMRPTKMRRRAARAPKSRQAQGDCCGVIAGTDKSEWLMSGAEIGTEIEIDPGVVWSDLTKEMLPICS